MRISTKRGDDGKTDVLEPGHGYIRVSKDDALVELLGTIDELQSYLGILQHKDIDHIQEDLYDLMSGTERKPWFNTDIPRQNEFILPKGHWHVARAICRRAERRAVTAGHNSVIYLNRLSDYLYKLALESN